MVEKNDVVTFLDDVIKRFEQFSLLHNASKKVDTESWDTPMGRLDVMRSTGDTFEKAGLIYCDLAIETPPVLAEKLGQQGSKAQVYVLEINFYPHNPYIPRGYMELRVNITDTIVLAGGTDIFPYFSQHEEDSTFFADGMKGSSQRVFHVTNDGVYPCELRNFATGRTASGEGGGAERGRTGGSEDGEERCRLDAAQSDGRSTACTLRACRRLQRDCG